MSIINNNHTDKMNCSTDNEAPTSEQSLKDARSCTYWVRHDGREFLTDPNSDVVNLARLTAYAEYGEEIHGKQIHHEIPLLKIDAPRFLEPLGAGEHDEFHGQNPDSVEVDGVPLLRTGE